MPLYVFFGPFFIMILSIPLVLKKVPRNPFFGFQTRTKGTQTDEQWYKVNFHGGIAIAIAGLFSYIFCMVVPYLHYDLRTSVKFCTLVFIGSALIAVVYTILKTGD